MKKLWEKLAVTAMVAYGSIGAAHAQLKLNDIKNTTGAGTNDLNAVLTKGQQTAQNTVDLWLVGSALVGVMVVTVCIWGLWKASKEERESPKGAIVGLVVGALMTMVPIVIGLTRNTVIAT